MTSRNLELFLSFRDQPCWGRLSLAEV